MYSDRIHKYLAKYGKKLSEPVLVSRRKSIDYIVVVPSLAEKAHLPGLLNSLRNQDQQLLENTLFLFVINNQENAETGIVSNNKESVAVLQRAAAVENNTLQIAYLDCYSAGNELPAKLAGVGLARKSGLDAALSLFSKPGPENLLIFLDADCEVSPNYLKEIVCFYRQYKPGAAAVRFEHKLPSDAAVSDAIVAYELFLLHYQAGLRYAQSYYDYHTVGSTITCTSEIYIKCEGMNTQKAGEDFYFLQKAAKLTPIATIKNATVYPAARRSMRVPFGTGQRITSYLESGSPDYTVHSTQSFEVLRNWLTILDQHPGLPPEQILDLAGHCSKQLSSFLQQRGFTEAWAKVQNNKGSLDKQKIVWFDGFKTMMLIHYLRDFAFPDVNLFDGWDDLLLRFGKKPLPRGPEAIPCGAVRRAYLEEARKLIWSEL